MMNLSDPWRVIEDHQTAQGGNQHTRRQKKTSQHGGNDNFGRATRVTILDVDILRGGPIGDISNPRLWLLRKAGRRHPAAKAISRTRWRNCCTDYYKMKQDALGNSAITGGTGIHIAKGRTSPKIFMVEHTVIQVGTQTWVQVNIAHQGLILVEPT